METRSRKRVSKNKKRNWKHVDVDDVEDHLEDVRLQERTGGVAADKPDDVLFFVDKVTEAEPAPKKSKREPKKLRCHANLEANTHIKPVKIVQSVKVDNIKKKSKAKQEKLEKGLLSATEKQALQQRRFSHQRTKAIKEAKEDTTVKVDLWDENANTSKEDENEYLQQRTKKVPPKPPKHLHSKPSGLPAMELPHPGQSCNPTYDDHQDLLRAAHGVEVFKEKKEMKIIRSLDHCFPSKDEAPTEADYLLEMSAGLLEDEDEDEEGESEDEEEGNVSSISINPPVRREDKKTRTERNKEQRVKDKLQQAKDKKELKKKEQEFTRVKSLEKQVRKNELKHGEKMAKKEALKEKYKDKPKKLGKWKFEAADMELKLSDELVGSLRQLKPEGHIIEDRYKSLQKRNIIEPRPKAKHKRKYKLKTYTKTSFQDTPVSIHNKKNKK